MEAMLSEFNYFAPSLIQASILDEYDESIGPTTAVASGSTIDFTIPGMPNIYRDLSNSYLEVQCKVAQGEKNDDIPNDAAVAPINLILHSMFKSVNVSVCGTQINDSEIMYPYRAFIETLLTFPSDVQRTRSKLAGWCLDLDGTAMDRILLATTSGVEPSPSFLTRRSHIEESRIYTLVGRPHADIFHQNLDIRPNCKIDITLTPSESKFALMAAATAPYKLMITSAKLFVRSKVVAPELILAHRSMLSSCNFKIPYTSVAVRKFQIAAGVAAHGISNMFTAKLPKRIVIGLVSHDRVDGAFNLNPFKFSNFGLTQVVLTVGGAQVPREALKMNFAQNSYGRAYLNTLASLSMDIGDRALAITPELWASAYNLYAFKLVPGPIEDCTVESLMTTGNVALSLTFAATITVPIDVIVYSETNSQIEITSLNNVIKTTT